MGEATGGTTPVGLVVVSHSRALGEAATALAREMLHGPAGDAVRIEVAAGLDETTFGTDATAIAEALTRADSPAGVVVLMDLGSAILSAELALEFVDDGLRERVLLCPGPLVEGLVAAAVAAAGGADRATVAAEATAGAAAKLDQLGGGPAESGREPVENRPIAFPIVDERAVFTVTPVHGLHARPAALLVQAVAGFDAGVELRDLSTGRGPVPAGSLTRVTALGATRGHEIEVSATGPEARAAVDAVLALAARGFGEGPGPAATLPPRAALPPGAAPTAAPGPTAGGTAPAGPSAPTGRPSLDRTTATSPTAVSGPAAVSGPTGASGSTAATRSSAAPGPTPASGPTPAATGPATPPGAASPMTPRVEGARTGASAHPASPGIALGPALVEQPLDLRLAADEPAEHPDTEQDRLDRALMRVREEIRGLRDRTPGPEAAIFDAHLLLADDPAVLDVARARIADGESATAAWRHAVRAAEEELAAAPGEYLRERAADVRAVGDQVLRTILDLDTGSCEVPEPVELSAEQLRPVVLVADDLTPARAADLDPTVYAGVVLAGGSATSHAAILLRAKGIPAVVGAGRQVLDLPFRTEIALDGTTGRLEIDPPADTREELAVLRDRRRTREAAARDRLHEPAHTRDGTSVLVGVNLGAEPDPAPGADLAGLVRTEFLFLDRATAPDVDEQEAAYRAVADALGGRRIVLRTLDVGGDKPLPYVPVAPEANPFLGLRGLRLALRRPDLLADQLRAIVRTAHATPVGVLFPMVSVPAELRAALAALDEAIAAEGGTRPDGLEVGIMVEVPAAALKAAAFAPHVDFLSIGTNDLTQYALAAERGAPEVAALADPLDPGVLRLIDATCRGAGNALVAVCGELAADPRAAALLVGLGVRELSVAPPAIALVKQAVRETDREQAAELAARALVAEDAAAVRALLPDA
ncbi:hypothetical protein GCM10009836_30390 [Pseudonocardia ailaonensis]|uniref:Phosphocarrier protein HPr n=1 Tax=Pseudonocardia ailaonensis TaxID=367279 RepID=A0ABN2N1M4_9PSEU